MADYAIGDIQGCYDPLMRLLDKVAFNEKADRLWFVGDLVNRGPQSLKVLRFIKTLPNSPVITLGNHDFHLLHQIFIHPNERTHQDDTLQEILEAKDVEEIGHWLRQQPILYYDKNLKIVMSHAGIAPCWTLSQARNYANELEKNLRSDRFMTFLKHMYGNTPNQWNQQLTGVDRLRSICNYFTRMRLCNAEGALDLSYKGALENAPRHLYPWFEVPNRYEIDAHIVFGHWAALTGKTNHPKIHAIDTGCLWGGHLTALHLQTLKRTSVSGMSKGRLYVS